MQAGLFHTYADHRMVMAGAVLGLGVPGLRVEDAATVAKTLPEFVDLWHGLVAPGTSAAGAVTA
jgi:3-phosphoshikimate 1-carboxyvinyltransferase